MIGTRLKDRYRLDSLIGQGGMGLVYLAYDEQAGQPVAVKILSPRPGLGEHERRFRREFRALSALSHPHIVSVYDFGRVGDLPFFVMEYVAGGDLRGLVQAHGGRMAPPILLPLAIQLCQALGYIHAQGVVHRDFKPENVLVAAEGAQRRLKLTDFGLAQLAGPDVRLTQAGELLGTVLYMAPEQARGQAVDRRADLYALGTVLFEALAGRHPFPGDDPVTVLVQLLAGSPPALRQLAPHVPEPWERLVQRLMARDPAERFASAEEVLVILRGWADTVSTDNLLEPRAARVELIFRAPLVGRDAELARLRQALDAAARGAGPLVLIRGEVGVGKTRLVEELAAASRAAPPEGRPRLWLGKSYEAERLPYQPFVEILRQCHRQAPEAWRQPARVQPLLGLLPELAADPSLGPLPPSPEFDAEAEKYQLFNAVADVLAAAAGPAPAIVCLDDLQWADAASLELFAFLARTLASTSVLLCATYRSEEVVGDHPVLRLQAQLVRQRELLALDLERLDRSATNWLVGAMFGDLNAVEQLGALVYDEAEGNPLFAEEIVKALVEEGIIYRAGGQWRRRQTQEWWLPAGIRSLLEHRLNRLGEPARAAAAVASVIGRQFDFDTVRLAGRFDEDSLLDAFDEMLRARVIREHPDGGERYDFSHDKIREVAYGQLTPARRTRLHRRVAEALERQNSAAADRIAGELARHYEHAGDLERALLWAEKAGDAAQVRLALAEALDRYQQALDLAGRLPTDAERVFRLQESALHVAVSLGRREAVDSLVQKQSALVDEHGWISRRAQVMLNQANFYIQTGDAARSEALCRAVLSGETLEPESWHSLFAHLVLGLSVKEQGRLDEAKHVFQHSIELADRIGSRYAPVARRELGNVYVLAGEVEEGLAHQRAALDLFQGKRDPDPIDLAFTLSDLAETYSLLGDFQAAADCASQTVALAQQAGHVWAELGGRGVLGGVQLRLGQWGAAQANLRRALEGYRRLGERPEQADFALQLAEIECFLDNPAAAHILAAEALAFAQRRGLAAVEIKALAALARCALAAGRPAEALAHADAALRAAEGSAGQPDRQAPAWLAQAAALLAIRRPDAAARAADAVLELPPPADPAARARALLCRGLALASQPDLEAARQAASRAGDWPVAWQAASALAALHCAAGRSAEADHWHCAAEADIDRVAGSFDDPARRAALRRTALAPPPSGSPML